MFRITFVVASLIFFVGIVGCSEERLPKNLPSDEGPISLTGGAV